MARLTLTIPNEVKTRLEARAAQSGYGSVEEYAEALLNAGAEEQFVDDDVEALLLQRLNDPRPNIELTDEFKNTFRQQVQQRRASRQS
jgi:plasmid stability protein